MKLVMGCVAVGSAIAVFVSSKLFGLLSIPTIFCLAVCLCAWVKLALLAGRESKLLRAVQDRLLTVFGWDISPYS